MTDERTIALVDLPGFTALTGVHGDDAAVDLVDVFTGTARDAIGASGAEFVKSIGDAVMIAATKPTIAAEAIRQVHEFADSKQPSTRDEPGRSQG